jgi:acyl-CoA reductase-like NAD-dependent aldehyde dehydrogenase
VTLCFGEFVAKRILQTASSTSSSSWAAAKPLARRSPSTPTLNKIAFTGSTEVGNLTVKAAARNLKRV